jgi:biotin-(acetyl-CoA carboxylase) ligase
VEVLGELVPALRSAASARGHLVATELDEFAARDIAVGKACRQPVEGTVAGIDGAGALLIDTARGRRRVVEGSLLLE